MKFLCKKNIKIKILTLNDTYQTNYYGRWTQKANEIIDNEKDTSTIFVKVFGGDFLFPSKYSFILDGHDMILASNASQFNVIGIGNHEFDGGKPVLAELALMSNTPLLCSNLDLFVLSQLNMKDNYSFTINNVKFGAVAFLTQETPQLSNGSRDLKFESIKYVFETQKKFLLSSDIKILVFHDNIERIIEYLEFYPCDKELVDVIVTGHQHIVYAGYIDRPNYRIPIVQMGQDAFGLGYIELDYNTCCKRIVNSFVDVKVIPPTLPETPEIELLTKWVQDISAPYFQLTIGFVRDYPLNGLRQFVRNQEVNMGDLVADSFLYTGLVSSISAPKENIFAITNSGSVRNNSVLPIGFEITGEYIYTILPFQNSLVAIEIIGRSNVNKLINYLALTSLSKKALGGWLQISKNLFFDYITNTFELIDGTQGETDKFYLIVTDFLADGGDGYTELTKLKTLLIDVPVQNSLINYIGFLGGNVSYTDVYTRIIQ
jgi:2',3'-cyclic-nucleotide 2'-phosphodiesterase/3'-nucleotidase/5'-nucleotidase